MLGRICVTETVKLKSLISFIVRSLAMNWYWHAHTHKYIHSFTITTVYVHAAKCDVLQLKLVLIHIDSK